MEMNDTANQLLFTTVPIWSVKRDGTTSSGTGFIFTKIINSNTNFLFIVTNKHVVENSRNGTIAFVKKENNKPNLGERITVQIDGELLTSNMDDELDIAIFPLGPILNQLGENRITIFFKAITKEIMPNEDVINEMSAIENITFIGYPNGIYDKHNNTPIIRQGITATPYWNDFNDKPEFLIDAGVYPGSSGSPVFIYNRGTYPSKNDIVVGNRILFLGMLSSSFLRNENEYSKTYLGLGKVLKGREISKFIDDKLKEYNSM